jgi:hypothetical protein
VTCIFLPFGRAKWGLLKGEAPAARRTQATP